MLSGGPVSERVEVAVAPAQAYRERRRLLSTLELAFPVTFVPAEGAQPEGAELTFRAGDRSLNLVGAPRFDAASDVSFSASPLLAPALRAARLREEEGAAPIPGLVDGTFTALAETDGGPVWARRGPEEWAALAPPLLAGGESLREHLRAGRFLALLPVAHWLRDVAPPAWSQPEVRATFVFDDPNLHWSSYGFIRYPELAAHATRNGYTATMAIVPRDMWYAHARAVRIFGNPRTPLSLALHGNDHVKRELQAGGSVDDRRMLLAQAIRRAAAFERRHEVGVAKVMIPPHGSTSREMVLEMPRIGIEAMCDSRPYPWLLRAPETDPLAGWRFVDIVDGGLPVIPRYHLTHSRDDLPLRAFLGQPVILYGHHGDLAGGLEPLAEAAAQVNTLGDVRWCSLGEIARSNVETRRSGARLEVRMSNPSIELDVPDGVEEVVVSARPLEALQFIEARGTAGVSTTDVIEASSSGIRVEPGRLRLRAVREDAIDVQDVPAPRPRAWPIVRRGGSELRDRLRPVVARVGGR